MKELIAALAVLADPNASPDDKAAALDKLSAYFNAQLDAEDAKPAEEAASGAATEGDKPETDSGADENEKEPSKEMASALATIEALTARVSKIERASAIGLAPRGAKPTSLKRTETKPAATMDPQSAVTISMIERAAKNTIDMLGK